MQQLDRIDDVRALVAEWRAAGDTVALVPTMGNLHAGHVSLVDLANAQADRVIVSIFINPTQFGPGEDFDTYPRTLEADADKLTAAGVDILFCPTIAEMYPHGLAYATEVIVPHLSDQLCGEFRPGHFAGVTTVVSRLLNICAPDCAVFGQKDYQQLVILRRMVEELRIPVQIIAAPTEREASGLALSSRNSFLSAEQRVRAAAIHQSLLAAAASLSRANGDIAGVEATALEALRTAGLEPEYVSVRQAETLAEPGDGDGALVILAAARLDGVRLIDNITVE